MLIVFDLDDTLIETTRDIAPVMLKKTLSDLQTAGLLVEERDLEDLYAINKKTVAGSLEALKLFLQKKKLSEKERESFFEIAKKSMKSSLPQEISTICSFEAREVLENLQKNHVLTLVSRGSYDYQMEKIRKAGMDRGFFRKIVILEENEKGRIYQELAKEFEFTYKPKEILVIGDRYEVDLAPAKKLGYWTILRINGRALILQDLMEGRRLKKTGKIEKIGKNIDGAEIHHKKDFTEGGENKRIFGNIGDDNIDDQIEIDQIEIEKTGNIVEDTADYQVKDLREVLEVIEIIETMTKEKETKTKRVEKLC